MSFFGATGTPVLDFWWRLLWVSKPEWVLPYLLFCRGECNVHSQDPPLVLYLLTSWWPARSRSLPHMHVQRWDFARIWTGNHPDRKWTLLSHVTARVFEWKIVKMMMNHNDAAFTTTELYIPCFGQSFRSFHVRIWLYSFLHINVTGIESISERGFQK